MESSIILPRSLPAARSSFSQPIHAPRAPHTGKLPPTNRIPWRGDSGLTDGQDKGLDLSGGWYDAGDHLKFSFTQAWTVTVLAWSLLEFPDAYDSAGEYDQMLDTIKWCVP